jgi:hypothetical protein
VGGTVVGAPLAGALLGWIALLLSFANKVYYYKVATSGSLVSPFGTSN